MKKKDKKNKKKDKEQSVAIEKLLDLKDAFVRKQSEIVDDVMSAIKEGKKNRKLKKLTKKFDKLKGKLGLLAEEIQHAIDFDFSDEDEKKDIQTEKKKTKSGKGKKKKKKEKQPKLLPVEAKSLKDGKKSAKAKASSRKSDTGREKKINSNKPASRKPASRKPVSRKPSAKKAGSGTSVKDRGEPIKVGTSDGPGLKKIPVRSMDLNAKRAVRSMQDVNTLAELDTYLTGETRSTVLKRADSRRNALKN